MSHALTKTSQRRLESVDERLQEIVKVALGRWDINVIEGHRSPRRQKQLYLAGKSRIDGENRLSKHNHKPSLAVDLAPRPVDWEDLDRFRRFGEYMLGVAAAKGIALRWGGDWDGDGDLSDQTFNDLVHFELED
jgi:peptidoglycan L-alanyl-D-glutamate endopeptidase CwlK